MRSVYFVLFCCLLGLASCNNSSTSTSTTTTDSTKTQTPAAKEPASSNLGDAGTQKLMGVITKYFALKDALVATKADVASGAGMTLSAEVDSMKAYLQADTAHKTNLTTYLDTITTQCKVIRSFKDEDCERYRLAFSAISSAIYGMVKATGLKNAHIYHEYCPMAFNEKGASWLSDESEIKNPYFGKKMMECGEVTDSL